MRVVLEPIGPVDFFQLEEMAAAEELSALRGLSIYTWKTECRANWLERGVSIVDSLGLVLLSASLPTWIGLADDAVEP